MSYRWLTSRFMRRLASTGMGRTKPTTARLAIRTTHTTTTGIDIRKPPIRSRIFPTRTTGGVASPTET